MMWYGMAMVVTAAATVPPLSGGGLAPRAGDQTAVFAGGCYWGVESVFEHVRGVKAAVSGFAFADTTVRGPDGAAPRGSYAEAVRVVFDPSQVTYEQLLRIFFEVAHDPTQRDRQGPDVGPQYRSVLFVSNGEQRRTAEAFLAELRSRGTSRRPVVTELAALRDFRPVEESQQDFAAKHPEDDYIRINDAPKLEALRARFPALYRREETTRR